MFYNNYYNKVAYLRDEDKGDISISLLDLFFVYITTLACMKRLQIYLRNSIKEVNNT